MKAAGLFAGIGGFELGFGRAGISATLLCEIAAEAQAVLNDKFPDIHVAPDVSRLTALPGDIDVVCAGFPCQNLSNVGNRTGLDGDQSRLVLQLFRLLRTRRVPWVILENVPFMLHLAKGTAMEAVLGALEELGYSWAYRVVDSRGFGLAQRRRRIYIVASASEDPRQVLLSDDAPDVLWPAVNMSHPIGFYWSEGNTGVGLTGDAMPPLKTGSKLGIPSPPSALLPSGKVVVPTIAAAEELQGFPPGWTESLETIGKARYAWRLIGNAVSVPVAEWLGNRLREPGSYDGRHDKTFVNGSWPTSAWKLADGPRYHASVSATPLRIEHGRLSSMSPDDWPSISHRALAGFIHRARRSSLRFPAGFLDSLETFRNTLT